MLGSLFINILILITLGSWYNNMITYDSCYYTNNHYLSKYHVKKELWSSAKRKDVGMIPYSGLLTRGANFRFFREAKQSCEN